MKQKNSNNGREFEDEEHNLVPADKVAELYDTELFLYARTNY